MEKGLILKKYSNFITCIESRLKQIEGGCLPVPENLGEIRQELAMLRQQLQNLLIVFLEYDLVKTSIANTFASIEVKFLPNSEQN